MGTMTVSASPFAEGTESLVNASAPPQGRLYVPPAYTHTSGDAAVALTSANHKVALGFIPEIDFALDAISFYVTAIGTTGEVTIGLHAEGTAIEPNGELNGSCTNVAASMTANDAPSPCVVGLWDSAGANAEVSGFEAYRAVDGSHSPNNGVRSNAAPTAGAPIYYTIDFGPGNAKIINRYRFYPFNNTDANVRAFPRAWTFWGSNAENPAVNTDADWTELSGSSPWTAVADYYASAASHSDYMVTNATAYRHYCWKITDRNGTSDYVSLGEIQLLEAQSKAAPGSLLQPLGSKAVGSSTDTWLRHTFDSYPLQRGTKYWIVITGADSSDFALSVRRNTPAAGSMFPDGCSTKQSTDGNVWTQSQQDNRPAMLNVVLNPTVNHCPQLMYGRCNGQEVPLYEGSMWSCATIPAEGIKLSCEALSPSTKYHVYLYDSSGTLTLEATTAERTLQDGVEVKSGASSRSFVGVVAVDSVQSGYQGPLDVPDARFVRNRYNPILKELSKDPNYVGYTRADHGGDGWEKLNNNDDFMMRVVSISHETLVCALTVYISSTYGPIFGLAVDDVLPACKNRFSPYIGGGTGGVISLTFNVSLQEGSHSIWPIVSSIHTLCYVFLTMNVSPCLRTVCLTAQIPC